MKIIKRLVPVLAAGVLAAGLTACGGSSAGDNPDGTAEKGTLRVAAIGDAKPYSFTKDGQFTGFDIELLKAMAKKMNVTPQFATQDFSGMLSAVNNGQYDMAASSIAITPERKQTVDFSDPYYIGYISILARKNSGIANEAGLKGKRLGLVQGTIHEQYAEKHLKSTQIVRFPDNNAGFSALQSGTIDAQFLDLPVARDYMKQTPGMKLVSEIPTSDQPAGFVVAKGNDKLRGKLNAALKQVIADGTWVRLYKRYLPGQPVPKQFAPAKNTADKG